MTVGPMRQRIRRYASEGHSVETASDMKKALDDGGGVRSVQATVVRMNPLPLDMPKINGVQQLFGFRYILVNFDWKM